MIPPDTIRAVRAAASIAEVIGERVPLRRAGANLVARCPFHEDRSPSFSVSDDRGFFYCFGCKASGDVFGFLMRADGVEFPEAVRALAERYGVEVPDDVAPEARAELRRARDMEGRLRAACEAAASFYEAALAGPGPGAELARLEVERREVDALTASRFRLGYAPAAWRDLAAHLQSRGVSPADAEAAGLLVPDRGGPGYHDRFRHRLMFPVCDPSGRVIAFSGRRLDPFAGMPDVAPPDAPKYVNSPETGVYRKGETLFGLHLARGAIRREAHAVVVEGNFDVVSLHARGVDRAVAPLGSAFTEAQGRSLRRYAEVATFAFDGDAAGAAATRAVADVAPRARLAALVARLPPGHDPDSLARERGAAAVRDVLAGASGIVEWLIDDEAAAAGATVPGRVAALRRLAPRIAAAADPIERSQYLDRAARALHLEAHEVAEALRGLAGAAAPPGAQSRARQTPRLAAALDLEGAPGDGAERRALGTALCAAFADPQLLLSAESEALAELLPGPWRGFFEAALDQWTAGRKLDVAPLLELVPEASRAWAARVMLPPEEPSPGNAQRVALRDAVRAAAVQAERRAEGATAREGGRAVVGGDVAGGERALQGVLAARRERVRAAPREPLGPVPQQDTLPAHLRALRSRLFGGTGGP